MAHLQALLQLIRAALQFIGATLAITGYMWPNTAVVQNCATYDYIVVGAGTAGCIIANRLAEDSDVQVMLIEAGGDPPLESVFPGLFTLLHKSIHDWNYKSVNDFRIAQYTINKTKQLTAGKMLGGSSSLHHLIHTRGHPKDYDDWADIVNDDSWNFDNMLRYFKKSENMVDPEILESENGRLYGTDGYVMLTKDHEEVTQKYLNAFDEIGHKKVVDLNGFNILGYTEPVLYISEDGHRQSTGEYLRRIKNKPNFHVMKNTKVTRIIFDDYKYAKGVVARNGTGQFKIFSTKEVIITAGAFNTPKLLMLSGIGPKKRLEKLDIEVISNLPVGKNLQDHPTVVLVQRMGASNKPKYQRDPRKFPTPVFRGNAALNKNQYVPDYSAVGLVFQHDSVEISQLSAALFDFNDDIGEAWYNATIGHEVMLSAVTLLHPKSRGTVKLKSKNCSDPPFISLNTFADDQDLTYIAEYLEDYIQIQKSSFFQSVNAKLVHLNIGCDNIEDRLEFWKCYAKALCYNVWNNCGTCSMGTVVDPCLKVIGVKGLRVADASVIPKITSAYINAPVMAIAEKAADMIKKDNK